MPIEGVVHALRTIHAALVPDGILVDTQPVSARAPIAVDGNVLGSVDMREWAATIDAVDGCVAEVVASRDYALRHEERLIVVDTFDSGSDCIAAVADWNGAQIPPALARRLAGVAGHVTVRQEVRLRLLVNERAAPLSADRP